MKAIEQFLNVFCNGWCASTQFKAVDATSKVATNGGLALVGSILMYGGATAPLGYLICDGSAVSRTTYAELFAILSTTYGAGDASTTFNLPDLRQRFPLGKAASGTGNTLGGTGGAIDHTHTTPAHYHGMGTGADLNITASGSHTHNAITSGSSGTTYSLVNTPFAGNPYSGYIDAATHTHTSGDFAGSIGLKTGGVDGNAAMTSGAQNPPYQVVNYIIKF
jgi:microcystin-dependent protein